MKNYASRLKVNRCRDDSALLRVWYVYPQGMAVQILYDEDLIKLVTPAVPVVQVVSAKRAKPVWVNVSFFDPNRVRNDPLEKPLWQVLQAEAMT
jgi:hypothetical protein